MLNLSLCRQCRLPAAIPFLGIRAFSTTPALHARIGKGKKSPIRVKSKKALASRAKRKAEITSKAEAKMEKLPFTEAINVLRAVEAASPNAMFELYIKTIIGNGVAVPKGRFKLPREAKPKAEERILVFAEGRLAEEAKRAGAHIVGGLELVDGILDNRIRATTYLSTRAFIRAITPRLGRFLGPQGLMPSERRGTVTDNIKTYMERLQGTSEWRADKAGNIHLPIGQIDYPVDDLVNNFRVFMRSVKEATGNVPNKGPDDKQKRVAPISKVLLSSTQGLSIRIEDY